MRKRGGKDVCVCDEKNKVKKERDTHTFSKYDRPKRRISRSRKTKKRKKRRGRRKVANNNSFC